MLTELLLDKNQLQCRVMYWCCEVQYSHGASVLIGVIDLCRFWLSCSRADVQTAQTKWTPQPPCQIPLGCGSCAPSHSPQ